METDTERGRNLKKGQTKREKSQKGRRGPHHGPTTDEKIYGSDPEYDTG